MESTDQYVGKLFAGRYLIRELLGRGGMGNVYLAQDAMLGNEDVALKLLHPQLSQNEQHSKRFLREVQVTRRVTHSNVVRTFDVGFVAGQLFLTMEYAPGETLKEMLSNGPLEPATAAQLLLQICSGLTAIHEATIIHRDLKSSNVIVHGNDVKITDFGVARLGVSEVTHHNEVIGSFAYMAPEVWRGKDISLAADLYSLGIMAYEMLTGEVPFKAEAPAELMCKHIMNKPEPIRRTNPLVPDWLDHLVLSMLEKEPARRPKSAQIIANVIKSQTSSNDPDAASDSIISTALTRLRIDEPRVDRVDSHSLRLESGAPAEQERTVSGIYTPAAGGNFYKTTCKNLLVAVALTYSLLFPLNRMAAKFWLALSADTSLAVQGTAIVGLTLLCSMLFSMPVLYIGCFKRGLKEALRAWALSAQAVFIVIAVFFSFSLYKFFPVIMSPVSGNLASRELKTAMAVTVGAAAEATAFVHGGKAQRSLNSAQTATMHEIVNGPAASAAVQFQGDGHAYGMGRSIISIFGAGCLLYSLILTWIFRSHLLGIIRWKPGWEDFYYCSVFLAAPAAGGFINQKLGSLSKPVLSTVRSLDIAGFSIQISQFYILLAVLIWFLASLPLCFAKRAPERR